MCVFSAAFSLSVNPSALALGGKGLHIRSQEAPPGSSVSLNPENSHAGEIAGPSESLLLEISKSGIGDLEDREAKSAGSLHAGQPKSLAESPWFSAGGSEVCAEGELLLGRWRGINPLCRHHHHPSLNYECPLSLNVCQLFRKHNCEYKLQPSCGPQYFSMQLRMCRKRHLLSLIVRSNFFILYFSILYFIIGREWTNCRLNL